MSITFEQAMTERRFHQGACSVSYGKTGKARPKVALVEWRRNGRTQTWKTRPGEFSIPIKHGLHDYGYLTNNITYFHLASECPALAEADRWWAAYEAGAFTGRL